ncbi:hypothetical protein B0J11DRAFT_602608 [Dendryphion nanum]|uniref:Uncharacterized protein n=1 Tax=Dendryphion nanum TaxID=256645 RepID=A0A9P9E3A9_9PLEO|nr:hypothetical protein B0J11DRAFT_602608 [Dendryphion nanum]
MSAFTSPVCEDDKENSYGSYIHRPLHLLARKNLHTILEKIPSIAFQANAKPTITDIYTNSPQTLPTCAPPSISLQYVFETYSMLTRRNFTPRISSPPDLNRAIWYWGLSETHSFNRSHNNICINVVLMVFTLACDRAGYRTPWLAQQSSTRIVPFIEQFVDAFMMQNIPASNNCDKQEKFLDTWNNSEYDVLVLSSDRIDTVLTTAMQWQKSKLKAVSEGLWHPMSFLTQTEEMTKDQFHNHGIIFAWQWMWFFAKLCEANRLKQEHVHWEEDGIEADPDVQMEIDKDERMDMDGEMDFKIYEDEMVEVEEVKESVGSGEDDMRGDVLEDKVNLSNVDWTSPLVRVLISMDDAEEADKVPKVQEMSKVKIPWMNETVAYEMLQMAGIEVMPK